VRIYATGARQLILPLAAIAVLFGLTAALSVVAWPLLVVAFALIVGYSVLLVRRTWVHVSSAGVAWRVPRRTSWATSTGSVAHDQIRGYAVVPQDVPAGGRTTPGRVAQLTLADGSVVTLPIWESVRKPQPQFGILTRELGKVLPRDVNRTS
jgi:hypothetical protein